MKNKTRRLFVFIVMLFWSLPTLSGYYVEIDGDPFYLKLNYDASLWQHPNYIWNQNSVKIEPDQLMRHNPILYRELFPEEDDDIGGDGDGGGGGDGFDPFQDDRNPRPLPLAPFWQRINQPFSAQSIQAFSYLSHLSSLATNKQTSPLQLSLNTATSLVLYASGHAKLLNQALMASHFLQKISNLPSINEIMNAPLDRALYAPGDALTFLARACYMINAIKPLSPLAKAGSMASLIAGRSYLFTLQAFNTFWGETLTAQDAFIRTTTALTISTLSIHQQLLTSPHFPSYINALQAAQSIYNTMQNIGASQPLLETVFLLSTYILYPPLAFAYGATRLAHYSYVSR